MIGSKKITSKDGCHALEDTASTEVIPKRVVPLTCRGVGLMFSAYGWNKTWGTKGSDDHALQLGGFRKQEDWVPLCAAVLVRFGSHRVWAWPGGRRGCRVLLYTVMMRLSSITYHPRLPAAVIHPHPAPSSSISVQRHHPASIIIIYHQPSSSVHPQLSCHRVSIIHYP